MALTDLALSPAAWAVGGQTAPPVTTLSGTLVRGTPDSKGYAPVVEASPEPHIVRTDLGVPASTTPASGRQPITAFAHLTDVHLVDAQSPMRLEYVDRLEDKYDENLLNLTPNLLQSSYRAHEMLTLQTADAMVQAVNKAKYGPVSGAPLAFAIQTGDNADNCQLNEFRWNIDILDGKTVTPNSGSPTKYEGVADNVDYDTHYWHPDSPPAGKAPDTYKTRYGFPQVTGLLNAARAPFQAEGIKMPWYSVFGNHDGLVQGNFPTTLPLGVIATGPLKLSALPPGVSQTDLLTAITSGNAALLTGALGLASARLVTADGKRKILTRKQVVAEHFNTPASPGPVGHGFTEENKTKGTAYYTFDKGSFRGVVLDTVNPNGYSEGSIDAKQLAWLKTTLAASTNKYVVVFSHHTSKTMKNGLVLAGLDLQDRAFGDEVVAVLLANPNVIAWVNGHTHRNEVWAHKAATGGTGFWEINTASHIDFPQQSRLIELVDNQDGSLSIFTTMLDHAGTVGDPGPLTSTAALAGLARELAANDPQRNPNATGKLEDRNVELLAKKPALV
ncbi:TIGR03767 family metallophosphoesterase [Aeromicrobium panaciterrae]|uniref:TIGR03767 family metallophosphoesterase n=1 Tax=Aeromicrobium panaciterrae TaxID=363861 RepID=UPI0031D380AF